MVKPGERRAPEWGWIRYVSGPEGSELHEAGADSPEEAAKVIHTFVWNMATAEERSVTVTVLPPCPAADLGKMVNVEPLSRHRFVADEDGRIEEGLEWCFGRQELPFRVEIAIAPLAA